MSVFPPDGSSPRCVMVSSGASEGSCCARTRCPLGAVAAAVTGSLPSRSPRLLSDRTQGTEKCDRTRERCLPPLHTYDTRFRRWSFREPYSVPRHLVKSACSGDGFSAQRPPQAASLPPSPRPQPR